MNKKIIIGIIILVVILGGIGWWGSRNNGADEVVIGASLPFTGASASFGERAKKGIDLALEDVNSTHKHKIKIVYEDDKGEASAAVTVINKLISQDKVIAIIGSIKSDAMLAMAPIAEKNKIVLFSPTAGAADITKAGDYIFRNIEKPEVHGESAANYLKEKGVVNVALFTAQASNAQGYGKLFKQSFESKGGKISFSTEYATSNLDFRTDISKAKQTNPEAFYLAVATAKDAGLLVKQIKESGYKGIVMASIAAEAKEFINTAGSSAEGVLITSPAFDMAAHADYAEKFQKKFGVESDWVSANSFDAVEILADAIDKCDKDTECIKNYLYSIKDYNGIGGLTTFDQNGDVIKPVLIKVVINGKFEILK